MRSARVLLPVIAVLLQVYGLRAFRIPLTLDFQNITNMSQTVYNGVR
jgi:hypothetical protein